MSATEPTDRLPPINEAARMQITIQGLVQGVGFRPFVFRLATEMGLKGWVRNSGVGVVIEVEASRHELETFLERLSAEQPPLSDLRSTVARLLPVAGFSRFEIRSSDETQDSRALVLPDVATCADCLREINDPADRRFRYPFTNCTNCGPRFTIIEAVPYDRVRTSMKAFQMCEACQREYDDPADRRFHAQPNACPVCGPQLELIGGDGRTLAIKSGALDATAALLRDGAIVAVKGLGGFHLMADAQSDCAVGRLRERKHREEKPFALMFPSLDHVRSLCDVSSLEEALLCSPAAPIILLKTKASAGGSARGISGLVAPGNPYLGVMLPYTPLHHLLFRLRAAPLIATSGNLADEPICTGNSEAMALLSNVADAFLLHNRPIVRHTDDSIARVMVGREMLVRRARGYAPLPVTIAFDNRPTSIEPGDDIETIDVIARQTTEETPVVLAVGAHLKNTVALGIGPEVFISQHIGDLETPQAYDAFQRVIADLKAFYKVQPAVVAADLHPGYLSSQYAARSGLPVVAVQHHYAHVLSCMAEHRLREPVLGICWDGTGAGTDGTIWGGEFLSIKSKGFTRVAHWRTFQLPGGEAAVKEPRRSAAGLLYELFEEAAFEPGRCPPMKSFSKTEWSVLTAMLRRGINAPRTSSVGRLFDAVASITGLRQCAAFEGQAAMDLEFAISSPATDAIYPVGLDDTQELKRLDPKPLVAAILVDIQKGLPPGVISTKFHNSLVESILRVAQQAAIENVVLSGGCFQNKYLTERAVVSLRKAGFSPFWHRLVPPNDGGIALGQVAAVRRDRG